MLLGFTLAFLIVLLVVFLTLFSYFLLHKIKGLRRIRLDVIFIIGIFIIVFIIHVTCIYISSSDERDNIWYGFLKGITEFYSQIGGLTFGSQNYNESNIVLLITYFASSLWLAITDALLIVIGFRYTLYSKITLLLSFSRNIFIFTSPTKTSLLLADNIMKDSSYNNPLIVFASEDLPHFDKDNEVHLNIYRSKYLYIPLKKNDKQIKQSILRRLFGLRCYKSNILLFAKWHNVHIFALNTSSNDKVLEDSSSDVVFDDIKYVKNETFKNIDVKKMSEISIDKKLLINYHVLSNREINFEFYERKLMDIFMVKSWKEIPKLFNINILNEAVMSGEDLMLKTFKGYNLDDNSYDEYDPSRFSNDKFNYSFSTHRTLVIGFGLNGQVSLGHEYTASIGGKIDKEGYFIPNQYEADVIDNDIDNVISSFIENHPSYIFKQYGAPNNEKGIHYEQLENRYQEYGDFKRINELLAFPTIYYRKENYNSPSFLKTITKIINKEYDSIIIALGDDEKNIECGNMIIEAIKKNITSLKDDDKRVRIYINLRKKNNNRRINFDKRFINEKLKNIFVYHYGNLEDIYSSRILDYEGAALINSTYEEINNHPYKDDEKKKWEYDFLNNCALYERKTNARAYDYRLVYQRYVNEIKVDKVKLIDLLKEDYRSYLKDLASWDQGIYDDSTVTLINEALNKKVLKPCLCNYYRVKSYSSKDYALKGAGYYWNLLAAFDHNRWMRYTFIYGRAFSKTFEPAYSNLDEDQNKKYWKNFLKLHDALLPYSKRIEYQSISNANYLEYPIEDYDYAIVVADLGFLKK